MVSVKFIILVYPYLVPKITLAPIELRYPRSAAERLRRKREIAPNNKTKLK